MKLKQLFFAVALVFIANLDLTAQESDSTNCAKYKTLYYQYLRQDMYRDAMNFWQMAYNYCGGFEGAETKFFANGRIGYMKLMEAEKDSVKKLVLRDSVYWMHECLIKKDPSPDWKGKYGSMLVTDGDKRFGKIDTLFMQSVHVLKCESSPTYIRQYFKHLIVNKYNTAPADKKDEVRSFIIDEYMQLTDYCTCGAKAARTNGAGLGADDPKKEKFEDEAKKYESAQEFMDKYLLQIIKDCETLNGIIETKLSTLPQNKEEKSVKVNAYINLLNTKNCQASSAYSKLMDTLLTLDATAENYFTTGKYFLENDKQDKACEYLQKAVELEGTGANKDKYNYFLAVCQYTTKNFKQAFRTAKLVEGTEYKGKALKICGDAIAATANGCGDTTFKRKANYWLANDYYRKAAAAGEDVSTGRFLDNAPTREEGFNEGVSEGATVYLECWGESTTARY